MDSWEQTVAQVILLSFMPCMLIMGFNERVFFLFSLGRLGKNDGDGYESVT